MKLLDGKIRPKITLEANSSFKDISRDNINMKFYGVLHFPCFYHKYFLSIVIINQIGILAQDAGRHYRKIFREQDNGWDMVKDININIFNLTKIIQTGGFIDGTSLHINMFKAYKENNCLDLFINYYGNFLAGEYLVEQIVSTLCTIKLFLYAYTLEEDNGKSFYCIMNNEFRSGNFQKISRYLPMIRYIYEMI